MPFKASILYLMCQKEAFGTFLFTIKITFHSQGYFKEETYLCIKLKLRRSYVLDSFFDICKIGMFTIGGGYAMIPLIEREVVNRGWLDKQDFMDLFAMTQSLPGIFAVNISIFVGYKLKKVMGSIVCASGTILPSFCIILAIALFFNHFQDNVWVMKIFNGIRPAVVALILVPCISAARSLHLKWVELILPAIGAVLIWKCGVSPAYIVLAGIIGGLIYTFWIKGKIKRRVGE